MNGLNNSNDDAVECPLCMEPFEVDDLTFFPCTCGYQICRFCWHRIRTDENKLCPACRKEYPENPADFKPLSQEEMIAFKSQKRQRDQQRKQKITENRKHLANVRVVQKNLVFVVGLPPRLADADILKKHEYFGKFGKIHKVVINPSTTYAGVQGPSASAYVTYVHNTDALRAIQSVNNIMIDGRLIKTSLGTTKYCSHFMKNQQCPKGDCMYLHELGDPEASFTKEEMHQGKHQEYEKRLHDALIASTGANSNAGIGSIGTANGTSAINGGNSKGNAASSLATSASSTSVPIINSSSAAQQKDAWPSLSVSPVNTAKESTTNGSTQHGKNKKDKTRNEKGRHEKNKSKSKNSVHNHTSNASSNKENFLPDAKDVTNSAAVSSEDTVTSITKPELPSASNRSRTERNKEKPTTNRATAVKEGHQAKQTVQNNQSNKPLESSEDHLSAEKAATTNGLENSNGVTSTSKTMSNVQRSLSSSSDNSDDHTSESSASVKSSSGEFKEVLCNISDNSESDKDAVAEAIDATKSCNAAELTPSSNTKNDLIPTAKVDNNSQISAEFTNPIDVNTPTETKLELPIRGTAEDSVEATDAISKLNLFDDSNSFFSSSSAFQQSQQLKSKLDAELRQNHMNNAISSHLPDLLNGIDGYQKTTNTNEWEEAFKTVMLRNTRHVEEQLLHQQHLQQQQQHHHQQVLQQQEEFLRMHEIQKKNNIMNNIVLSQMNGPLADFPNIFQGNNSIDMKRAQAQALLQQQHLPYQHAGENVGNQNNLFAGNMSKFFDFHKCQQQLHHHYLNGQASQSNNSSDPHRATLSFLENGRVNPQFVDNGSLRPQQAQVQKQRLVGMFETMSQNQPQGTQLPQQTQINQFSQNSIVDDDLGFDPFIETQKGLAELMENEVVQQQNINTGSDGSKLQPNQPVSNQQILENMQRTRMPPPGFNHTNTLGFGGSFRAQNSSKILPFMNMSGNVGGNSNTQVGQPHQSSLASNWNPHFAGFHQHQGQPICDSQLQHQLAQAAAKGYSNNDWTAMDPAILSFRQFSSFPQAQVPSHPQQQQQQQDLFLQHLAQQQNTQGFNNQAQQQQPLLPGINMTNMLNAQQPQQTQVNANVQGMLEFLKSRQFV